MCIRDRVCIELLRELFDALPKKDRDIFSKTCSVFGYPEATLKEIGMYHICLLYTSRKGLVKVLLPCLADGGDELRIAHRVAVVGVACLLYTSESTGSYHCPVVSALLENGIFVSVINSLRMKRCV